MEINILYIARHHLLLLVYCALNCFQRNINKNNCFFYRCSVERRRQRWHRSSTRRNLCMRITKFEFSGKIIIISSSGFSITQIPFLFIFLLYRFMKDNAFPISSYLKSVFVECTVSFVFFVLTTHHSQTTTTTTTNHPSLACFISSYTKSIADADAAAACIRNLYFLIKTNSFSYLFFVVVFSIRSFRWREQKV